MAEMTPEQLVVYMQERLGLHDDHTRDLLTRGFEKAAQVEREACARAAQGMNKAKDHDAYEHGYLDARSDAAAAIRARGKERDIQEEMMDAYQFGNVGTAIYRDITQCGSKTCPMREEG